MPPSRESLDALHPAIAALRPAMPLVRFVVVAEFDNGGPDPYLFSYAHPADGEDLLFESLYEEGWRNLPNVEGRP